MRDRLRAGHDSIFFIRVGERKNFYQSKYDYFSLFSYMVVIFACISAVSYFYSDCQLFGRFAGETLFYRCLPLICCIPFTVVHRLTKDYNYLSIANYLVLDIIVICTCICVYHLPDRSHANEGLLILQVMYLAIGLGAPVYISIGAYISYYTIIFFANLFIHYEDYDYIISLGLPLAFGILLTDFTLEHAHIQHYKIARELKKSSFMDHLTGMYNRTYVSDYVEPNKATIFRKGGCLMMLDIDHFKNVNDTYGHAAGDDVLRLVSDIIMDRIRSCDYIIRWGGEEFIVMLPETTLPDGCTIAERLRRSIEQSQNEITPITISIGVAPVLDLNLDKSIDLADEALYEAKRNGRNQVRALRAPKAT